MFDFFFQKIANLVKFRLEKNFSNSFVKNWQNLREKKHWGNSTLAASTPIVLFVRTLKFPKK
jgi:hypothetical protein